MSHITKVKTRLKDKQILCETLKKIGYHLHEGGVIISAYRSRQRQKVEMVAEKNGKRLGFRRSVSDDNCYEILADWETQKGGREEIVNEIFQIYSSEKVIKTARLKGYSLMQNRTNRNGQIEITLRKVT